VSGSNKLIVLVLGSSRAKYALFEGDKIRKIKSAQINQDFNLNSFLKREDEKIPILCISVHNNQNLPDLKNLYFFDKRFVLEKYGWQGFYEDIGIDRVCNLLGIAPQPPKGGAKNIVILDFGTYTTLTVVSKPPSPLKGELKLIDSFVIPGISFQIREFSKDNNSLPALSEFDFIHYCMNKKYLEIPESTKQSAYSGIVFSIQTFLQGIFEKYQEESSIYITGGWADLAFELASQDSNISKDKDLCFNGGRKFFEEFIKK